MGFVVKAAKEGSSTISWLAPKISIGSHTLGPRQNAAVFQTHAEAQTAADTVAASLARLGLDFSVEPAIPIAEEGYVVKLLYDNILAKPRWVIVEPGRGLGPREQATVFPDREAAESEAKTWRALMTTSLSVVVEPA